MKKLVLGACFLLLAPSAWAQTPDPGDSIILESKTVTPGAGRPYMTVKVFITNKDSVGYMVLALKELSTSGGAYGLLSRTASGILTFSSVVTNLTPTFRLFTATNFSGNNGSTPDSFVVAAGCEPTELSTVEPPNSTRKAVWEIKFDTVLSNGGAFELDTARVGSTGTFFSIFSSSGLTDVPVNFAKSVIRVLVPDPRDSIILESKTVTPGSGRPYMTIKAYITNKDSLTYMVLALKEVSTSGGAYGILSRNALGFRTFASVITNLTYTFRYITAASFRYDSSSPDSFIFAAGFDGSDPATIEPPNATRKAIWEIKFDTVLSSVGTFVLDSAVVVGQPSSFINTRPVDVPVNFVKSVITVAYPKGDFNQDFRMSAADIVLLLNCVFQSMPPPGGASCDLNCDGQPSAADVVLEVNAVFNQEPFPC